jgi:hypothetical protein
MKPEGLYGENDHIPTGIYIPINTLFTFVIDNHSRFKMLKFNSQNPGHHVLLYCDIAVGIYEVIDTHCSSQCYIGGNGCRCKYVYVCVYTAKL